MLCDKSNQLVCGGNSKGGEEGVAAPERDEEVEQEREREYNTTLPCAP
jgi:hypothetical protein